MSATPHTPKTLRLADLTGDDAPRFHHEPDAEVRAAIAAELGLTALKKARLAGQLTPVGARDWHLTATLGATVVQPCVVTLEPVTTRIDAPVERRYLAQMPELPVGEEMEMPDDETAEPLPELVDFGTLLVEALALNVPAYPRADGAALTEGLTVTEPGAAPLTDEAVKPFAGLAALKARLDGTDETD